MASKIRSTTLEADNITSKDGQTKLWQNGRRFYYPGEVVEIVAGHADGRTVRGYYGPFQLEHVQGSQNLTSTWTSIGCDISYQPPPEATIVIYECSFQMRFIDADPILHFRPYVDGNEIDLVRSTYRVSSASGHQDRMNLQIVITIGPDGAGGNSYNTLTANYENWTTPKLLSWRGREYDGSYEGRLHTTNNWDGGGSDVLNEPFVKVTAIA